MFIFASYGDLFKSNKRNLIKNLNQLYSELVKMSSIKYDNLHKLLEDLENMKVEIIHLTELVRNLIEIKEKIRLENLKWLSKKKQKYDKI